MILARDQIGSGPASQDVIQASGKSGKAQERAQGVEVSYSSNKKISQIQAVHSRDRSYTRDLWLLKGNGQFWKFCGVLCFSNRKGADIAKENIGYGKLSRDARYEKPVESTQEESDSNKEKICYTSTTNIALVDPQESEAIGGQEDTPMSGIQSFQKYVYLVEWLR